MNVTLPEGAPEYLWVLALLVSGFGTWYQIRSNRQQSGTLQRVDEQVSNTHPTNLRDDLDAIHADIRLVHADLRDLRDEVRADRSHAYDFEREVRERFATIE
ncbi:DUF2746 domain-containing protein [Nocardia abscessus]|uniref:DUF2746 domain-containing protein n=1 Tax=Nocardia abscessus TaxID=120957 RepID=UPI003CC7F3CB